MHKHLVDVYVRLSIYLVADIFGVRYNHVYCKSATLVGLLFPGNAAFFL